MLTGSFYLVLGTLQPSSLPLWYLIPVTWYLILGNLYLLPGTSITWFYYLVLCNPHLFPPLSSVMSAFVQTLPVPPVPGDLHPDTTCSNGKINGFSFTSVQFCKIYPLIHTSHDSHGEGGPCLVNCFAQKYLTEGLRNKVGTQALSRPAGWLSYISRA